MTALDHQLANPLLQVRHLKTYARHVQAVFQDPYGALNPRMRVGRIIGEPMEVHGYSRHNRQERIQASMKAVGLLDGSEKNFRTSLAADSDNVLALPVP